MNLREAAQQALEALEIAPLDHNSIKSRFFEHRHHAIIALRAALAETHTSTEREHMTEIHRLRAAGRQALGALQFCLPLIEDYGDEEQLAIHHKELAALTEYAMQRLTDVQQEMEPTINEMETVEPVAWILYESLGRLKNGGNSRGAVPVHTIQSHTAKIPLYTAPPKRTPLTDEHLTALCRQHWDRQANVLDHIAYARAIERAHGIGGEK